MNLHQNDGFWTMTLSETDIIGTDMGATYFAVHRKTDNTGWLEDDDDKQKKSPGYHIRPVINIVRTKNYCFYDDSANLATKDNPVIIGDC